MRSNTRDAARRAFLSLTRGVIVSSDDKPMMQTNTVRLLSNEEIPGIERLQTYGHSSVPMPADKNGKGAEVVVGYIGGSRSHPMILGTDDRRVRQKNLKPGDVSTYHWSGANSTFSDKGLMINMGSKKKPMSVSTGKGALYISDTKAVLQNDKASVKVEGSKITSKINNSTIVQDGSTTTVTQGNTSVKLDGSTVVATAGGTSIYLSDGKIGLGGQGASQAVLLQGMIPSTLVFATR